MQELTVTKMAHRYTALLGVIVAVGCGSESKNGAASGGTGVDGSDNGNDGADSDSGTDGGADGHDEAGDPSVPDDCADLFIQGEFRCAEFEACEHLAAHPAQIVLWHVALHGDGDHSRELDCIERYLVAEGIASTSAGEAVTAEANYTQVQTLCRATMVEECVPEALPERCAPLDEQSCANDPLCSVCKGDKLDPIQNCWEEDVFAFCRLPPGGGTPGWGVPYVGPDGSSCWMSGCMDNQSGWTADPERAVCPDKGGENDPPVCSG
jgi:hypothetical protein